MPLISTAVTPAQSGMLTCLRNLAWPLSERSLVHPISWLLQFYCSSIAVLLLHQCISLGSLCSADPPILQACPARLLIHTAACEPGPGGLLPFSANLLSRMFATLMPRSVVCTSSAWRLSSQLSSQNKVYCKPKPGFYAGSVKNAPKIGTPKTWRYQLICFWLQTVWRSDGGPGRKLHMD